MTCFSCHTLKDMSLYDKLDVFCFKNYFFTYTVKNAYKIYWLHDNAMKFIVVIIISY